MKEYAQVIDVEGDNAVVLVRRTSACGKCGACGMGNKDELRLTLPNIVKAKTGDFVLLDLTSGKALNAALIAYGFPLLMMIVGAILGSKLPSWTGWNVSDDVTAAISALLLTFLSWGIIKISGKKIRSMNFTPRIEAVVPVGQAMEHTQ